MKIVIVGDGNIGKYLGMRLSTAGHEVSFYTCQIEPKALFPSTCLKLENPGAVFLAISTKDHGEAARDYIRACLKADIPVITCEKGALAYHADVLLPYLEKIGFTASVGGGTRMLRYVRDRHIGNTRIEIDVVLNGTLNFVFDEIRRGGRSLGEACGEAGRLGYAEPGSTDPLSLINGELRDVKMKTCVFFNTVMATKKVVTPNDFGNIELNEKDIESLCEKGGDYRLVVSFSNAQAPKEHEFFGRYFGLYKVDGWHIVGGFRRITQNSGLASWLPGGVGNAIHIVEGALGSGGKYTLTGPGAGYDPTTSAMLADFARLCRG